MTAPCPAAIDLSGAVAVVTGGSRGIGAETCRAFAAAGAAVAVNFLRRRDAAEKVVEDCRARGARAQAFQADVTREDEVRRLFDGAERLGPVSVVVANAGIWEGAAVEDMTLAEWNRTVEQNLTSAFLACREAARRMKPSGGGSLVLLSSTAGQRGESFHSAYAATKGAVISLVKSLATELGPFGIRVNAVAPGWVDTEMSHAAIESRREEILASTPLRRVALAEDVAGPIVFLASPLARHITGEILNVNGGSVLSG